MIIDDKRDSDKILLKLQPICRHICVYFYYVTTRYDSHNLRTCMSYRLMS